MNFFYEKALFVKVDVADRCVAKTQLLLSALRAMLLSALSWSSHSLVARCIGWDPSFFGLLKGRCNLPSGLPLGG